jgi:hypothetical protein
VDRAATSAEASTAATDIDEVLILRGKRMNSNVRESYGRAAARVGARDSHLAFLERSPIKASVVLRFVGHLRALFEPMEEPEEDIVTRGYF